MFCKFMLALCLSAAAMVALAQQTVELDYQYNGDHGVDFSTMPRGPLKVAEFTDARDVENPRLLDAVNGNRYQLQRPVPDLIRDALLKAFVAGDAELVEEGATLVLFGEITDVDLTTQDGEVQVTLKAKAQLKNSAGSQLFSAALFGRGSAPAAEGIDAALAKGLDQLVNSLLWDDYFLMQVID